MLPSRSKQRELRDLEQQIRDVTFSTLCALVQVIDLKDLTTGVHSSRLVEWCVTMAKLLDLSTEEAKQIEIAAFLHDLGKVGIPDDILKKPSKLTMAEQAIMRKHPEYGWAVMKNIPGCQNASLMILHHHEVWNGEGYPAGLKGQDIPLGSRIVAVADAFDAMTTDRCYRKGIPLDAALSTLKRFAGIQFDPGVVDVFTEFIRPEQFQAKA